MVMDPTSGNPYDTLSPVTMSFSHHEDDYRRSTSVEQLEADYINFHVAEESSEIVDVGILPERRETEGSVDLNLVKENMNHIIFILMILESKLQLLVQYFHLLWPQFLDHNPLLHFLCLI